MRKPGEPIYLRKHMVALVLAVLAAVSLPYAAGLVWGPLTFETQFVVILIVAIALGVGLHLLFRSTAENEPVKKEGG